MMNYVALIGIEFHLAGVISHVFDLVDNGFEINGKIFVIPSKHHRHKVKEHTLKGKNFHLEIIHLNEPPKLHLKDLCYFLYNKVFKSKKDIKTCFITIKGGPEPRKIIYLYKYLNPKNKLIITRINEGMGTLNTRLSNFYKDYYRTKGITKIFSFSLKFIKSVFRWLFWTRWCKINKWHLLDANNDSSFNKNEKVVSLYQRALVYLATNYSHLELFDNNEKDACLYIANPAGETKGKGIPLEPYEQLQYVKYLRDYLALKGKTLYIKPYFKDNTEWEKEGFTLKGVGLSTEQLLSVWKPEKVFGMLSTSLLTSKLIFNIPTYDVSNLHCVSNKLKNYIATCSGYKILKINFLKEIDPHEFEQILTRNDKI